MKKTPLKRKSGLTRSAFVKKKPAERKFGPSRGTRKPSPTISDLKKKLWNLCKQITRKKYGNVCYTCGKSGLVGSNWHTGHFIPSSVCSTEVRYCLDNLRPCCYHCNINLSGNWIAYENNLIKEMGEGFIKEIKAKNENTKGKMYRSDWYEEKIISYREILRDLEAG